MLFAGSIKEDFLNTCLLLVTKALTFLLPGYKVDQDGIFVLRMKHDFSSVNMP